LAGKVRQSPIAPHDKTALIASLVENVGFRYLVEELEAGLEDVLGGLANAKSDAETLRLARLFQAVWRLVQHLKDHPASLRDEIERTIAEATPEFGGDPLMTPGRHAMLKTFDTLSGHFSDPEKDDQ